MIDYLVFGCFWSPLVLYLRSHLNEQANNDSFGIFLIWCNFAVDVLLAVKKRLIDPLNNLKNWDKGDPCTSNWTGIQCHEIGTDSHLHITEL